MHCINDDSALYDDTVIPSFGTTCVDVMEQQWRCSGTAFVRGSLHLTSATLNLHAQFLCAFTIITSELFPGPFFDSVRS